MMQTDLLYKFRKSILFFIELISFLTVTAVFMFSWSEWYVSASFQMKGNFVVIIIYALMLTVFLSVFGGFKYGSARLHDLTFSTCLALLFTDFFTYFELCLIARDLLRPWGMLICAVIQIALAFLCCYCTNSIYYMVNHIKNILAVTGGSEPSKALIRKMKSIELRYSIQRGILADKGIEAIKSAIGDHDAVLICDDIEASLKSELIRYCYSIGKKIYVQPSTPDIILSDSTKIQVFDSPVLVCRTRGLTNEQKAVKRFFDIVVSLIGIILASPFMAAIAIAIKLDDGGPVIFKQNRVTENGKIFNVFKFRSMIVDADKDGAKKATVTDDRITRVGKVIRPIRLDELPQLFNILFGSMSLVGPRPERTENVHEYTNEYPEFALRHRVKGGLTGYAQIYGKYNTSPIDKLHLDLMYIENYSLILDIKLIIMTFKILFVKESSEGFDESANANVKKPEITESEGENN